MAQEFYFIVLLRLDQYTKRHGTFDHLDTLCTLTPAWIHCHRIYEIDWFCGDKLTKCQGKEIDWCCAICESNYHRIANDIAQP